jgi:hypothetical protein
MPQNSSPEKGCRWVFAPQEGGREGGPNDAMMQNFRSKPYNSLVRESVQNSLDAVCDNQFDNKRHNAQQLTRQKF